MVTQYQASVGLISKKGQGLANLLEVTSIQSEVTDNLQLLKATFTTPENQTEVWFRTDEGEINTSAEPFLPIALVPAMRRRWTVILEGEVSGSLVQGMGNIQRVLSSWHRKFHPIELQTAGSRYSDTNLGPRSVAAFFSGGVDSFFTTWQHRAELTHLIFVHGFDLPLEEVAHRERMAENARELSRQLGLELVEVETNLRDFGDPHVSWTTAFFGAGLAAVGLLLSPRFSRIYIPASVSEDQLIPLGSHPELDHHWGNAETEFVHDGAAFNRSAKIEAIAGMPLVQKHLRVCYQPVEEGLNCGRCRKCVWTMLVLESMGNLGSFTVFPQQIDLDALRLYLPTDKHQQDRFREAIERLHKRNANPELCGVLNEVLQAGEREAARSRSYVRRWVAKRLRKIGKWISSNETSES
jgi:hypothetical protein